MTDGIPTAYAAFFNINVSSNDVHILIGRPVFTQEGEPLNPSVSVRADYFQDITMSMQSFKQLTLMLSNTLETYEKANGPIYVGLSDGGQEAHRTAATIIDKSGSKKSARSMAKRNK